MRQKRIACALLVAMLFSGCRMLENAGQKLSGITPSPTESCEPSEEALESELTAALTPTVLTPEASEQPTEIPEQSTAGLTPTEEVDSEGGGNPTEATGSLSSTPTKGSVTSSASTSTPSPTSTPTSTPTPTPSPSPTLTPTPTAASSQTGGVLDAVSVNGKSVSVGASVSTLTSTLGTPVRKDKTDGNFTYYVYNKDYKNLSMVAVSNTTQKVVGFFVCSVNISYGGLTSASTLSAFQSKYGSGASSLSELGARQLADSAGTAVFFFDIHNDNTLYAVSYMAASVSWSEADASTQTALEKEIFDICNAYRARYGVDSLAWSDDAAAIAKAYAEKMAAEDFFSHTSPDGSTMTSRASSLNYRALGENIIANYMTAGHNSWGISGSVADATGWIGSSGHRSNILDEAFTRLGVGITDGSTASTFRDYGAQVFYTPY